MVSILDRQLAALGMRLERRVWVAAAVAVAVQTTPVIEHRVLPHEDMLNLQHNFGFSNNQMCGIVSAFRRATHVPRLIAPNYEQFLTQMPKVLEDICTFTDYHPADSADPVPLVYYSYTSELLDRLQKVYRRQIRIVHNSVDSGM